MKLCEDAMSPSAAWATRVATYGAAFHETASTTDSYTGDVVLEHTYEKTSDEAYDVTGGSAYAGDLYHVGKLEAFVNDQQNIGRSYN